MLGLRLNHECTPKSVGSHRRSSRIVVRAKCLVPAALCDGISEVERDPSAARQHVSVSCLAKRARELRNDRPPLGIHAR